MKILSRPHVVPFTVLAALAVGVTSLSAGVYEETIAASNPLAFYRTSETSGTTVVNSVNPGVNDLTYYSTLLDQPSPSFAGVSSASVYFSGISESGIDGTVASLASSSFSVEYLVQDLTDHNNTLLNFQFGLGSGAGHFGIGVWGSYLGEENKGKVFFELGLNQYTSNAVLGDDWNHIVFTYDKDLSEGVLYLNGVEVVSGISPIEADGLVRFGQRASSPPWATAGYFSDLSLYSSVLSSAEVADHYAAAVGVPEPSILALFGGGVAAFAFRSIRRRPR